MPRQFKVHEVITREDLSQLEDFAREPGRKVDQIYDWLQAHGYQVGRTAAYNWLRNFRENDRFTASGEVAKAIMEASKGKDAVAISDAAVMKLAQVVFEGSLTLQADEMLDTRDVQRMTAALKNVITSKRHLEKLQEEMESKQKLAAAEAEKLAKSGGTATDVVAKVREILGIAA